MWKRIRRRVWIESGLHFDYEVSPHRAFLAKMLEKARSVDASRHLTRPSPAKEEPSIPLASVPTTTGDAAPAIDDASKVGDYVPFKQSRLRGQTNPLRPPLHVETVLIGRALGQPTGYLFGVGFRIRDDGYLEAEFADGVRKFETYEKFKIEVTDLGGRHESA
jgi:hypothetical protein